MGKIPALKRAAAISKTNGRCWYCGCILEKEVCIDHIYPKDLGGSSELENLVPCCRGCNSQKGTKTLEEYRDYFLQKTSRPYCAAKLLELALCQYPNPYENNIQESIEWLKGEVGNYLFYGEQQEGRNEW